MKTLSINEMTTSIGGVNGCDVALGLAVGIWGAAVAIICPLAGFAIGYFGGMLVGDVCH